MTLKKESQKAWGELVHFDAMDAIFRACAELESQDNTINREAVKTLSGVGFTTQLAAGIALYKTRRSLTDQFKNTPEILAHTVCQAFETAVSQYNSELEERLKIERDLFLDALKKANEEYESLLLKSKSQMQTIDDLESKLAMTTQERDELVALVSQQDKSLSEHVQQQQQLAWKLQQSQQQMLDAKQEKLSLVEQHCAQLKALKQESTDNLQRSAAIAENEQNRLMRLIAQDRDEHKRAMKESKSKISDLEKRLESYQRAEFEKEKSLVKATEKLEESRSRETVLRQETEELKLKLLKAEKQANQTESDLIQGALSGVVAQLRAEFRKPEELETS